ncbi:MAG TPA: nucleoside-diphosphate kinase [Candidatus Thermoplasmatota archaeon]|nr:nucleoside-diphosphate kinase [Candidatus Thermoplasmatota archaeon]
MERTFAMVKPDGVQRGLVGEVLARYERRGLKIVGLRLIHVDRALAEQHYAEHRGKPFYEGLVRFITSGPTVILAVEGKNAVQAVRETNGATDPLKASPGTIRGDFGTDIGRNVVHGSDSLDTARRELALYFPEKELLSYTRVDEAWTRE